MQIFILTFMVVSKILLPPQHSVDHTTPTLCTPTEINTLYQYPNNQFQSFRDEDEFYQQLNRAIYEEYPLASLNIRQKMAFKDVSKATQSFYLQTNSKYEIIDLSQHTFIHPNRQIYFLASFQHNSDETYHKFLVIDAETQVVLLGDSHFQESSKHH
ncbi:hypothetical protein [Lysinibacillus cavernae]|uniref:hypothetical protein n=1 Tax=Lysinibacillus cavernae TaxID=2666135 RepID=UPI0012D9A699|nr:hypothetical protein [Lysinibacillus cavernae]